MIAAIASPPEPMGGFFAIAPNFRLLPTSEFCAFFHVILQRNGFFG
jgi:hypothetical protein